MKTGTWILLAAAVIALAVLIVRPAREGAKAKKSDKEGKKDSDAKKKRKEQDAKNTKQRYGAACAKDGKFWNRARNKCMDPWDAKDNRNCKGTIVDGWCYRTKGGKIVTDEEFDKIASTKKCKPGQVWDYYKDKCVTSQTNRGNTGSNKKCKSDEILINSTTGRQTCMKKGVSSSSKSSDKFSNKMTDQEKIFAELCRKGETLTKNVATGLYQCRAPNQSAGNGNSSSGAKQEVAKAGAWDTWLSNVRAESKRNCERSGGKIENGRCVKKPSGAKQDANLPTNLVPLGPFAPSEQCPRGYAYIGNRCREVNTGAFERNL